MWSGTCSRGAQILQPHVVDPVVCFMDKDRLMFPVPLLHARAEKTDPWQGCSWPAFRDPEAVWKSYLQRQMGV